MSLFPAALARLRGLSSRRIFTANFRFYSSATAAGPLPLRTKAIPDYGDPCQTLRLFTKSRIRDIFSRFAPRMDAMPYLAAAHVLPMRVNNYVLENLIDWYVKGKCTVDHQ